MSKKKPSFNPDDANRSYLIHEFLTLHKDFIESQNIPAAKKILRFLSNEEKLHLFIDYAIYNPHPLLHDSVQDDIEQTQLALNSWMNGATPIMNVTPLLNDLKAWIAEKP